MDGSKNPEKLFLEIYGIQEITSGTGRNGGTVFFGPRTEKDRPSVPARS